VTVSGAEWCIGLRPRIPPGAVPQVPAQEEPGASSRESPGDGAGQRRVTHIGTDLLAEDEDTHGDHEPAEGLAQGFRWDASGEAAADEVSGDGCDGDYPGEPPVDVHAGEVTGQAREGLHGDHQERGADGDTHRKSAQQGQGGDDEEASSCRPAR
jgi:hypothetical protein